MFFGTFNFICIYFLYQLNPVKGLHTFCHFFKSRYKREVLQKISTCYNCVQAARLSCDLLKRPWSVGFQAFWSALFFFLNFLLLIHSSQVKSSCCVWPWRHSAECVWNMRHEGEEEDKGRRARPKNKTISSRWTSDSCVFKKFKTSWHRTWEMHHPLLCVRFSPKIIFLLVKYYFIS